MGKNWGADRSQLHSISLHILSHKSMGALVCAKDCQSYASYKEIGPVMRCVTATFQDSKFEFYFFFTDS